jgi:short-subunit dehydrogenase
LGSAYGPLMAGNAPRKFAVVTGASSGIGLELSKLFASDGYDLLITSDEARIKDAAREIGVGNESVITAVQLDLTTDSGVDDLYEQIKQEHRPVDAIALNAGRGAGGAFVPGSHPTGQSTSLSDELTIIDLNVRSTTHLAKHVLADMVARGEGKALFTSSIASTMPGSFQAVYNASKAYVQSLVVALRDELKDTGVTVTSLMPGPTDTHFFETADMLDTKVGSGSKDDPVEVARMGYEAMQAGEERAVAESLTTKMQAEISRVLPDRVKAAMHRNMAEPGSGE